MGQYGSDVVCRADANAVPTAIGRRSFGEHSLQRDFANGVTLPRSGVRFRACFVWISVLIKYRAAHQLF